MTRIARILAVTAGLLAFGAVAGALAGGVVAALVVLIADGARASIDLELLQFGATLGAVAGAALLPLAGWLLMRRVPLGRAIAGTLVGTIAGGLLGWFTPVGSDELERSLLVAVAGFAVAVLLLRRSATASGAAPVGADSRAV